MIYSPAINTKIGSTEYWEIQEWMSCFVSQLYVHNNSSDSRKVLDFLLARSQNRVWSQTELPGMKCTLSQRAEGWQNSPCISCLYHNFPCIGEDRISLHQADKPDSQWHDRLEFRFPQIPDSSFTQMRSNRHSHQDTSSHSPDKQGSCHTSCCIPAGGFCIYLDDPFCKLFLLLSVKSCLLLKLSLKLLYRYILYR